MITSKSMIGFSFCSKSTAFLKSKIKKSLSSFLFISTSGKVEVDTFKADSILLMASPISMFALTGS